MAKTKRYQRKPGDFFKGTLDVIAMILLSLIVIFIVGALLIAYPIFTLIVLVILGIIYLIIRWRH